MLLVGSFILDWHNILTKNLWTLKTHQEKRHNSILGWVQDSAPQHSQEREQKNEIGG